MRTSKRPCYVKPLLLVAIGSFFLCGQGRTVVGQNTVLVADQANNRVLSYNVNGSNDWSYNGIFASSSDGSNLAAPGAVLYDSTTNAVYIAEASAGDPLNPSARILKYGTNGQFQSVLTTFTDGEVPDHMVLAPDGNLLVSNAFGTTFFNEQNNIYKVDIGSGSFSEFIAEPDPLLNPNSPYLLNTPRGMTIAGNTLYVANRNGMGSQGGSVLRFNATTGAYLDAGIGADPLSTNDDVFADWDNPQAVHYDAATNTLTASVFGNTDIVQVDLAGTAASTPPILTVDDMPGGVQKIYDPNDINGVLEIDVVNGVQYWSSYDNGAVYRYDALNTKTNVVTSMGNAFGLEEIPFQGITAAPFEWSVDGFGDWNGSNWIGGQPDGNATSALLGGTITADTTVYMDSANTVKLLQFDNANSYVVAGAGPLTLEADSGSASILVDSGSHQLQLPVALASDTDITVAAGTTLAFNNQLNLNGFTLTLSGAGTVDFNNAVVTGGGSIAPLSGIVRGAENLGDYLVAAVPEPTSAAIFLTSCLLMAVSGRTSRRA